MLHSGDKQVNSSVLFFATYSGVLFCAIVHCTLTHCAVQCHVCSAGMVRELPADCTAAQIRPGEMICRRTGHQAKSSRPG